MRHPRRLLATVAVLTGLFLSAIDTMVVVTVLKSIVADLGGMRLYSWVVAAYMIASTAVLPICGKLGDTLGRRRTYLGSVAVFLLGSFLCGWSQDIGELIVFRALQGLGAGGVLNMSFTIIADIYSLEARAKMQGVFSAVWGISSIFGPLLGGLLVEQLSWRWVFYVNIPLGLLSMFLLVVALREEHLPVRLPVDAAGAVLLTMAAVVLLFATRFVGLPALVLLGTSGILVWAFVRVERCAPDPVLPLDLFANRVFRVAVAVGFFDCMVLFGILTFVPLYAQLVLGLRPLTAGALVTPLSLSWVASATASGWLMLRFGYHPLVQAGHVLIFFGVLLLVAMGAETTHGLTVAAMMLTGGGMGLSLTPAFVAVQTAFAWRRRGVVTSSAQFFRNIGGTVGTAALGTVLVLAMAEQRAVYLTPEVLATAPHALAEQLGRHDDPDVVARLDLATVPPEVAEAVRAYMANSLQPVFLLILSVAGLAAFVGWFFPRGAARSLAHEEA